MSTAPTIHLRDYTPPAWLVPEVFLRFELGGARCLCHSRLQLRRNPAANGGDEVVLDGRDLQLEAIAIDGEPLAADRFSLDEEQLRFTPPADAFELSITTALSPADNTALEGLYQSSGNYCTQCEAEGFRRITWFPDRPDVLSVYTVEIIAPRDTCPVLLSNGNPVITDEALPDGLHRARWEDPFPKPSYLFALVAGDLSRVSGRFRTADGRDVDLHIYTEAHNVDRCDHALASLQRSMAWDEATYGLSYDLDVYNVVAVDDFNMGAMENKGLNIFNSKYVLADPQTATDQDFLAVESVIAHEYFHNWSGNRVTCRDWFQLSLKEGLTVFRDQEFSSDLNSRPVKRIEDVRVLRARQFPEDAGPMAHPVRPESYIEINNFYTVTVYEKGAEVIRMMHTLLGDAAWKRGLALYFERHDGQAVTCEDFVCAMEDASGVDLRQFRRWYSQLGTPVVWAGGVHDPQAQTYTLTLRQSIEARPAQPDPQPMHIPVRMGLLRADGTPLPLQLAEEAAPVGDERVLDLREAEQRFVFTGVDGPVRASLLRGFSAPVRLRRDVADDELSFLMAHDRDAVNRWEAAQQLITRVVRRNSEALEAGDEPSLPEGLIEGLGRLLEDHSQDTALRAEALSFPDEESLGADLPVLPIDQLAQARRWTLAACARALEAPLLAAVSSTPASQYKIDADSVGARRLNNLALAWLVAADPARHAQRAVDRYHAADNLTDVLGALRALNDEQIDARAELLAAFETRARPVRLVMDKWFSLQASSRRPDALETVKQLMAHADFERGNPNRVRSLVGGFCIGNPLRFHAADGSGYQWLVGFLLDYDALNPQVAARLSTALTHWRRYDAARQGHCQSALKRLLAHPGLSRDTFEIASRALAND